MTHPSSVHPRWLMPAEWAPQSRCWMAWPCRPETFSGAPMAEAFDAYAGVADAIAGFEPLSMVCSPEFAPEARRRLDGSIELIELPISDSWIRDTGPTFVISEAGELGAVDWRFNAWGGNYPDHEEDTHLAGRLAERVGAVHLPVDMFFEGGAITVDGEGTLITTDNVPLNANRNPHITREKVEGHFELMLGASKTIWLPGIYEEDETDGHVDEVACFVRPGQVLHLSCSNPNDPNHAAFAANLAVLRAATDAKGRKLEVVTIEQPAGRREKDGVRLTLSYLNFLIGNGFVLMPAFGVPEDEPARGLLAELFPDRKVVQLAAMGIVNGGGGIHCITQQQPAVGA